MTISYPTDITDDQWELIRPLLPAAKPGGRPRSTDLRAVINALFYTVVAGGAWRMMPKDYPPWQTVYDYFRDWRLDGTWQKIHDQFAQWVRVKDGHDPTPSAASMDSQSVKTGILGLKELGFDGGKKIKGHKRHLMVDTLGLVMMVVVTAANVSDQQGARLIFERLKAWPHRVKRLVRIWVDGTYDGIDFMKWTMDTYRWILETVKRSDDVKGFVLLPKRWVIERTWGWLNWSRRLSKDYEVLTENSETFIYIAMIRILLRRLA
jgi:putative transposase